MTPQHFAAWFLSRLENVPPVSVDVRTALNTDNDARGQCKSEDSEGTHKIFLQAAIFAELPEAIAIIAHEAYHAAMFDCLNTLYTAGIINGAVMELLNERGACVAEEIARRCVEYRAEIENYYNAIGDADHENV